MDSTNRPVFLPRELSYLEYLHCAVGAYRSPERPLENTIVVRGCGSIDAPALQAAVNKAAQVNPGVRVKLQGKRQRARWVESDKLPEVRVVARCDWDGNVSSGANFIYERPLCAAEGVVAEFIIANTATATLLIFRSLHALMDGVGCVHFLRDVFRALNQQPLTGSDCFESDAEIMRRVDGASQCVDASKRIAQLSNDFSVGSQWTWRTFTFDGTALWLPAKIALAISAYCQRFSDGAVRIKVPVNLRRHLGEKRSTLNYAGKIYIDLQAADTVASFNQRLHALTNANSEAVYRKRCEFLRCIPLRWLDFFLSRTMFLLGADRKKCETVILSNLGAFSAADFSTMEFTAEHFYSVPYASTVLCIVSALDNTIGVAVGMPVANGATERFDDFVRYLESAFAAK